MLVVTQLFFFITQRYKIVTQIITNSFMDWEKKNWSPNYKMLQNGHLIISKNFFFDYSIIKSYKTITQLWKLTQQLPNFFFFVTNLLM